MSASSYETRDGLRWRFTVDLPATASGKRRQVKREGFATQADALAKRADLIRTHGRAVEAARGSVAEVLRA